MISYGGGHCNIMKAVYAELSRKPDCDIVYLALTTAPRELSGINYVTISEVAKKLPYYEEIIQLGEKYGLPWHKDSSGMKELDTICYYGIGMFDLISKEGKFDAEKHFNEFNRKAFLPVKTMKNVLEQINPDVCIITSSPRMELAAGLAADMLKIPVVRINDLPVTTKILHRCKLCVMNEWAKEYAIKKSGVPGASIVVTGQPAFNNIIVVGKEIICKVNEKFKGERFQNTVTFFLENGTDQQNELALLYSIAAKRKNTSFIIKLHPNQDINDYNNPNLDNVFITKESAVPILHISDLVITTFSTTGMEAAMLEKPLIVLNLNNLKFSPDYVEMGIAISCTKSEELEDLISSILNNESEELIKLQQNQKKFSFVNNAPGNVCKVIESEALKRDCF